MITLLYIVVVLLLIALLFLLFTPVVLAIDTLKELYNVRWGPVSASLTFREEHVRYRLHLPFYTREGELHALLEQPAGRAHPSEKRPRTPARARKGPRWRPPLRTLLHTFRVRRLHWRWDSGDVLWNAWLFPVFHMLRLRGNDVAISFTGRNELQLIVDNNLYRMLKAVLLHKPKTEER